MTTCIGIVSGARVDTNRDGTEPGRILDATISDIQDVQSAEMPQAGDEYHPPRGVRVVLVQTDEAYKIVVAADDGIAPVMDPGGRRLYATDSTGETVVAELRLNPDGTAELFNGEVALTLQPDGTALVENGAASFTMSPEGHFTFHGTQTVFDHHVIMQDGLEVFGNITSTNDILDGIGSMDEIRTIYDNHSPGATGHPPKDHGYGMMP